MLPGFDQCGCGLSKSLSSDRKVPAAFFRLYSSEIAASRESCASRWVGNEEGSQRKGRDETRREQEQEEGVHETAVSTRRVPSEREGVKRAHPGERGWRKEARQKPTNTTPTTKATLACGTTRPTHMLHMVKAL